MRLKFTHKIAVFLIDLISRTWRFRVAGEIPDRGILAFWHGTMLPVWIYAARKKPIGVVSPSKDGEILSELLRRRGYRLIRGSSSKSGKDTLARIVESAAIDLVLMTPDGPRGPKFKFKAGAVVAAHRSQAPLALCGARVARAKFFDKSWDDFALPLPFSKIELYFQDQINIPESADRERISEIIDKCEKELKELQGNA